MRFKEAKQMLADYCIRRCRLRTAKLHAED